MEPEAEAVLAPVSFRYLPFPRHMYHINTYMRHHIATTQRLLAPPLRRTPSGFTSSIATPGTVLEEPFKLHGHGNNEHGLCHDPMTLQHRPRVYHRARWMMLQHDRHFVSHHSDSDELYLETT